MITQKLEVEVADDDTEYRIVGEICGDRVFWAFVEYYDDDDQVWRKDTNFVSYQRDSISVPNLEYDPDVLLFFAGQGLAKIDDTTDWKAELDFVSNQQLSFLVSGNK